MTLNKLPILLNDLPLAFKNLALIEITNNYSMAFAIEVEEENWALEYAVDKRFNSYDDVWSKVFNGEDFKTIKIMPQDLIIFNNHEEENFSALDILNDAIAYYSKAPDRRRATNGLTHKTGTKVFISRDGKESPIGRYALPYNKKWMVDFATDYRVFRLAEIVQVEFNFTKFDDLLDVPYKGHPIEFWADLEALHFYDSLWSNHTLNNKGKEFANELRVKWKKLDKSEF